MLRSHDPKSHDHRIGHIDRRTNINCSWIRNSAVRLCGQTIDDVLGRNSQATIASSSSLRDGLLHFGKGNSDWISESFDGEDDPGTFNFDIWVSAEVAKQK